MALPVFFTAMAQDHLVSLHAYITNESGYESRADAYIQRIVAYCETLAEFPKRGALRDDILPNLRTIRFERRITIAFMVLPEQILIEGVFYGGRHVESFFDNH